MLVPRSVLVALVSTAACAAQPPAPPPPPPTPPRAAVARAEEVAVDASAPRPCEGDDFGLPREAEADVAARFAKKRGTMGVAKKYIIATSHRLATEAGLAVLRSGGTAADAFVAAALVQDVVLPGVTSTAGLAGVLVYEAKTKKLTYVHGGLADPIDPARRWHAGSASSGSKVLVPGAPAAYAELAKRFGKKSLASLVEPAAKLAADGFPVDRLYARSILGHRAKLEKSAYGKKAFFREGRPIAEGETLKLADFAATLRSWGKDPSWFYKGRWPREAVALANANGGSLAAADFATYAPEIAPPLHGRLAGHDLYGAGHGGVKMLVSLEAYALLRGGRSAEPPSRSADALEMLLRVQRATNAVPMLHDRSVVTRGPALEGDVEKAAAEVASRVRERADAPLPGTAGTHSSAVVVVDGEGNVVVGTHTIETLNWGEGLFVGGVPLSTAGATGFDDPTKASVRMRIDPLTTTIAMKDGAPVAALTVYGTGLHPADVQILDAVLARGLDAEDAVLEPRVGYFAFDHATYALDYTKNSVDPRLRPELLCALKERGFGLERSMPGMPPGYVDTGFPTLVLVRGGELHGMTPDMSYIEGVAAGD